MIDGGEEQESHEPDYAADEGFKPEKLDARLTLYQDILDEVRRRIKVDQPKYIDVDKLSLLETDDEIKLDLPAVGSNQASNPTIYFEKLKEKTIDVYERSTVNDHDHIVLTAF